MTTTPTESPIMVRVDITRDELRALKVAALEANMSLRAYLAAILRERITT